MTSLPTIGKFVEEQRVQIDDRLDRLLPAADTYPRKIHEAVRYSVFEEGTKGPKRLRPILAIEAARLFGEVSDEVIRLGCGLEMIHTYSLIHDDLPPLDNDDLRRGKPTVHKEYGEATAILSGDALLTLAFETLAGLPQDDGSGPVAAPARLRVIRELARAIGTRGGLLAGQVVDLEAGTREMDEEELQFIISAKTGALIRMSVRAGAIYVDCSEPDLDRITRYGAKIGLAFQIADDVLDMEKDARQHKPNYANRHGVAKSREDAAHLVEEACDALAPYGERAERLREIAHYVIVRNT
jgi:geranylgeranyl diphosphate synthase type II